MKKKRYQHNIGKRIFIQLLLLLTAVFLCVFLAFNVFFHRYIMKNVHSQLDAIEGTMSSLSENIGKRIEDEKREDIDRQGGMEAPDLSKVLDNKIRSEAKAFNTDSEYNVTDYDNSDDVNEIRRIAGKMKEHGVSLSSAKYVYIKTDSEREYYISAITDPLLDGRYMVFTVETTVIGELVDTINLILALILAAALVISLILANILSHTVTDPVRELSEFAVQLGAGDFSTRDMHFRDDEFNNLAKEMNAAAEKLDAYDKDQRTFFQNVSHELRTPLMSIRCYAEGITSGVMEPKQSGAVIISETGRLTELVEDLLYISRVDRAESAAVNMQEADIRETVAMCATGLEAVAKQGNISFVYDFDDNEVLFSYNETHMYRAISNLISNALRYAHSTVTLGCHNKDGHIEISVADDGDGISKEDMPHIFDRFYKGKGGKNGIGLAIVKSVAELHGGSVSVCCDRGTVFTILF